MPTRQYTQTARAEHTAQNRRAALEAVKHLVLEEGRYDVPLDLVAERAGVSTRTILRHFGSREGLLEAVFADAAGEVGREREPVRGDDATNVRRLVDHYERVGDGVLRLLAAAEQFPLVRRITEAGAEFHRAWVEAAFADALDGLGPRQRRHRAAVLAAVTDVHVWALLRRRGGLGRDQVEAAMRGLVEHARGAAP